MACPSLQTFKKRTLSFSCLLFLFSSFAPFHLQAEAKYVVQTDLRLTLGSLVSIPQCPIYSHTGSYLLSIFN